MLEPGQPPRELNRLDSKNWTPTPLELQRDLAERVRELARRVDVLVLLDQVDIAETGVATPLVCEAAHAALVERSELRVLADSRRGLQSFPPLGFKMNAAELGRHSNTTADMARCRFGNRPATGDLIGRANRSAGLRHVGRTGNRGCREGPPGRACAGAARARADRRRRSRRRRHGDLVRLALPPEPICTKQWNSQWPRLPWWSTNWGQPASATVAEIAAIVGQAAIDK